jgi:hypothetical protein
MTSLSTMCGGQQAYPVYITIGNISKALRRKQSTRATVLLAYLPVDTFHHITESEERSRLKHEVTHRAMAIIMEPLRKASREGVEMQCADGHFRRIYPIMAGQIGDWPEQCGMACTSESGCPKCKQKRKGRGSYGNPAPKRKSCETLIALSGYFKHNSLDELEPLGLKPWWPWWANMPYLNFFATLMPDLLHQLHQGMIKTHLVGWVSSVMNP